ncbi:homocysteine S-methyltransferase family protein [bacterium]|nr:homocysteine S-methyltransferase family protein [bacterium]
MKNLLENNKLILMEAAIIEQLRRSGKVKLHPALVNTPLIYEKTGKAELTKIYQGYLDIALQAEIPFIMCTPTWRANQARVADSDIAPSINTDAASFLQELRDEQQADKEMIKIGGMIGCKNDSYKPEEGLSAAESEQFHSWQIDQLAQAGVDFLIAATLPSVEEAKGIARAMAATAIPYIISFVISRDGHVLDSTDLMTAVKMIDAETDQKPLGFMINCAYPTFLCAAGQPTKLFDRLIGYQANASSLDHCDLDGADQLETEIVTDWGKEMLSLNRSYGIKILGGCCGTGVEHLRYITDNRAAL